MVFGELIVSNGHIHRLIQLFVHSAANKSKCLIQLSLCDFKGVAIVFLFVGYLLGQLAQRAALVVADRVGVDVAAFGVVPLLELDVDVGERHDEARVVGSQQVHLLVVVQAVRVQLEYLVGLTETVPGAVVLRVEFYKTSQL